ncbi:hypothetical protein Cgig2_028613 [Carnegiea gigantea]|uniref:Uncharacterized protein n=1 Tax=Carnegiea gigantea TaxID=171969 RepID=A0A9Q1K6D5_9CARY|nr:hypothetical protein Cgig2_028613 [Carnegiea gigantea]
MTFDRHRGPHFSSPHNDPLVVELKVANALMHRILVVTESFADIITRDCLKRLKHLGREIIPLVHPILEVNPTGVICLSLQFGDKPKVRNLEVDFLVLDVATASNVILGRPTLHKVKVVIASYLPQLQYEADDGSVRKLQGDQRMARECYLVSIRPLVEHSDGQGLIGQQSSDKKPWVVPPPPPRP